MKKKDKFQLKNNKNQYKAKLRKSKSTKGNISIKGHSVIVNVNMFRFPNKEKNKEGKRHKSYIIKVPLTTRNPNKKILIENVTQKLKKENVIMSLRKELNYQKLYNKNLMIYKDYIFKNSSYYRKNCEDIIKYKKQLNDDLSDFVSCIENYEKLKLDTQTQYQTMIKTNESIIGYKIKEQNSLKEKLNKLNEDTMQQNNILQKLKNKIDDFYIKNDEYFKGIENCESEHSKRYTNLLKEYKRVENEYIYYSDIAKCNRKLKLDKMNKNLCAEEEGDAILKLSEKRVKNEYLQNIAKSINFQMNDIQIVKDAISKEESLLHMLGKYGAQKYKQRILDKYYNKVSRSKSSSQILSN